MERSTRRILVGCGALSLTLAGCFLLVDTDGLENAGPATPDGPSPSLDAATTPTPSDSGSTTVTDAGDGLDAGDGCACPAPSTCVADGCELPSAPACDSPFLLREGVTFFVKVCPDSPPYTVPCNDGGPSLPTAFLKVGPEAKVDFELQGTDRLAVTTLFDCSSPSQCVNGGNSANGSFQPNRIVALSTEGALCNRVKIAIRRP